MTGYLYFHGKPALFVDDLAVDRFLFIQNIAKHIQGCHGIHDHTAKNDNLLPRKLMNPEGGPGHKTLSGFTLQLLNFSSNGV
jgi:hypothetical protein